MQQGWECTVQGCCIERAGYLDQSQVNGLVPTLE